MHTGPSLVIHPLDELMPGGGESSHCHLTLWMVMHLSQTGACWHFLSSSSSAYVDVILHFGNWLLFFFLLEVAFRETWGERVGLQIDHCGTCRGKYTTIGGNRARTGRFFWKNPIWITSFFLCDTGLFLCYVEPHKRYKHGSILLVSNLQKKQVDAEFKKGRPRENFLPFNHSLFLSFSRVPATYLTCYIPQNRRKCPL
jgi:hypothetical protein